MGLFNGGIRGGYSLQREVRVLCYCWSFVGVTVGLLLLRLVASLVSTSGFMALRTNLGLALVVAADGAISVQFMHHLGTRYKLYVFLSSMWRNFLTDAYGTYSCRSPAKGEMCAQYKPSEQDANKYVELTDVSSFP